LFAVHQEGGHTCIQVFFFRSGQNWGNRPYFPKHDRGVEIPEILDSFLAQFYDDRDPPKLVLISHEIPEHALLEQALSVKAERRVEVLMPQRGEKREVMAQAVMNARESLARRMAESATQLQLLEGVAKALGLDEAPRRIEVYDNSHIQGTSAVGAMIVAGPEGFIKNQYRKFNIKSTELTPGDDFGMMREVLTRRFKRLLKDQEEEEAQVEGDAPPVFDEKKDDDEREPGNAPDLVIIDGGQGQLSVACEVFAALGVTGVKLVAIAKGPDRDAGRERFFMAGREPFQLEFKSPVLFYLQRLRDEAHRFAIGTHRTKRAQTITSSPLDEIEGIGPTRKRALLNHFGSGRAVTKAGLSDIESVKGISKALARKIYEHFHDKG